MRRKAPGVRDTDGDRDGACGVWLDTALLKRTPGQAVLSSVAVTRRVTRPATVGLRSEVPARSPQARVPTSAGTRQTDIASFFRLKPTGQTVTGGSVRARHGAEGKKPTAQSPRPRSPSPREQWALLPGVQAAVCSPSLPQEPKVSPAPLQPPPRCFGPVAALVPPREEEEEEENSLAGAFTWDSEGCWVLAPGWAEAGGSPDRRPPGPSVAGCSQLFTEDSQGCRVIAHRRPLRETTNLQAGGSSPGPLPAPRPPPLGSQAALLFSQDSQGNRVIKHRLGWAPDFL
ncbi:aurora kinase A and ninein-interacting protein [Tachyglossus aculeatus]|uniref:aurora kinase A and ninein-interacting protein n=1 Tax=Tachyglossus aculeatus TaxID=9261 RepID=UPI0018F53418|nr:aurora kinase A and ninein-interacting protein [Tachyglossus aculeatus]